MSASLVYMSMPVKANRPPNITVSICTTWRGLLAVGTGPLRRFFFHLERMMYFSFRISYILGTDRRTPCSRSRK